MATRKKTPTRRKRTTRRKKTTARKTKRGADGNTYWIKGAVSAHPGVFSAKAKRAGMSTQAYAQAKKNAPGTLGKQARLALTLAKMRKKKSSSGTKKRRRTTARKRRPSTSSGRRTTRRR